MKILLHIPLLATAPNKMLLGNFALEFEKNLDVKTSLSRRITSRVESSKKA